MQPWDSQKLIQLCNALLLSSDPGLLPQLKALFRSNALRCLNDMFEAEPAAFAVSNMLIRDLRTDSTFQQLTNIQANSEMLPKLFARFADQLRAKAEFWQKHTIESVTCLAATLALKLIDSSAITPRHCLLQFLGTLGYTCASMKDEISQQCDLAQVPLPSKNIVYSLLNHLIDLNSSASFFSDYYVFRRIVAVFRTVLLPVLLQILKHDLQLHFPCAIEMLSKVLKLPYALSLHQFSYDSILEDLQYSEINFPIYFRPFLMNTYLFKEVAQFAKSSGELRLVRIMTEVLGKVLSANGVLFSSFQICNKVKSCYYSNLLMLGEHVLTLPYDQSACNLMVQSLSLAIPHLYCEVERTLVQSAVVMQLSLAEFVVAHQTLRIEEQERGAIPNAFNLLRLTQSQLKRYNFAQQEKREFSERAYNNVFLVFLNSLYNYERVLPPDQLFYNGKKWINALVETLKPVARCLERVFYLQGLRQFVQLIQSEFEFTRKESSPRLALYLSLYCCCYQYRLEQRSTEQKELEGNLVQLLIRLWQNRTAASERGLKLPQLGLRSKSLDPDSRYEVYLELVLMHSVLTLLPYLTSDVFSQQRDDTIMISSRDQIGRYIDERCMLRLDQLLVLVARKCIAGLELNNPEVQAYSLFLVQEIAKALQRASVGELGQVEAFRLLGSYFRERFVYVESEQEITSRIQYYSILYTIFVMHSSDLRPLYLFLQNALKDQPADPGRVLLNFAGMLKSCSCQKHARIICEIIEPKLPALASRLTGGKQGPANFLEFGKSFLGQNRYRSKTTCAPAFIKTLVTITSALISLVISLKSASEMDLEQYLRDSFMLLSKVAEYDFLVVFDLVSPLALQRLLELPLESDLQTETAKEETYFVKRMCEKSGALSDKCLDHLCSKICSILHRPISTNLRLLWELDCVKYWAQESLARSHKPSREQEATLRHSWAYRKSELAGVPGSFSQVVELIDCQLSKL